MNKTNGVPNNAVLLLDDRKVIAGYTKPGIFASSAFIFGDAAYNQCGGRKFEFIDFDGISSIVSRYEIRRPKPEQYHTLFTEEQRMMLEDEKV